ncbi:hypothetical protein GCM10027418_08500 [Mariniluteicoccus endophyticus]
MEAPLTLRGYKSRLSGSSNRSFYLGEGGTSGRVGRVEADWITIKTSYLTLAIPMWIIGCNERDAIFAWVALASLEGGGCGHEQASHNPIASLRLFRPQVETPRATRGVTSLTSMT